MEIGKRFDVMSSTRKPGPDKKRGRPRLDDPIKYNVTCRFRMSEFSKLYNMSKHLGMRQSDIIRFAVNRMWHDFVTGNIRK